MTDFPRRDILGKGGALLAGLAAVAATAGTARAETNPFPPKVLRRFVIERDIPNIGQSSPQQLCSISQTSDNALAQLAPHIQWELSYVADNKTFCVYLAEDEEAIRKHGQLSGFPVTTITLIDTIIDPTTAANAPAV